MGILALDLAGQTGWAVWRAGDVNPVSGAAKMPRDPDPDSVGKTIAAFRDWLNAKVLSERIDHFAIERVFINDRTASSAPKLLGLTAVAEEIAYRRGLTVNKITTAEWRGRFLGKVAPPKGLAKTKRSAWWKMKAREACAARGWNVATDDEADACGILVYERSRLYPEFSAEGGLFGYGAQAR
jgi:hypothetical protein